MRGRGAANKGKEVFYSLQITLCPVQPKAPCSEGRHNGQSLGSARNGGGSPGNVLAIHHLVLGTRLKGVKGPPLAADKVMSRICEGKSIRGQGSSLSLTPVKSFIKKEPNLDSSSLLQLKINLIIYSLTVLIFIYCHGLCVSSFQNFFFHNIDTIFITLAGDISFGVFLIEYKTLPKKYNNHIRNGIILLERFFFFFA